MSSKFAEEDKVRALYRELLNQWNDQKAQGMANLFTEDGSLVGFDGSQVNSAKDIEAHLSPIFSTYPTAKFITIIREVRALSPESALLRAAVGMVPRGHTDINPAVNAIQSLVAVKQGSEWKVALFQNTPAAFHGRPEEIEKLSKELRVVLSN